MTKREQVQDSLNKLRNELYLRETEAFQQAVHEERIHATSSHLDTYIFTMLLVACATMVAVVKFAGGDLFDASEHTLGLDIFGKSVSSVRCSDYNDNFHMCVKLQSRGLGCSWYANCNKCISKNQESEGDKLCDR
jgi:hypothetical protein